MNKPVILLICIVFLSCFERTNENSELSAQGTDPADQDYKSWAKTTLVQSAKR